MYDWATKLGIGGVLGWLANVLYSSFQRRIERGRDLIEKAKPELIPLGWFSGASSGTGRVRLKNRGSGVARNLSLSLSQCSSEAKGGKIQPGEESLTAELYFEDQPIYREEQDGELKLVITYVDRFENSYKTVIPVSQRRRADGRYNIDIHWEDYKIVEPKISLLKRWKIGG